jgi:hypothetical protein
MKYAWLDFDPTDTQDQYAIAYNDYADKSGDDFVLCLIPQNKEQSI